MRALVLCGDTSGKTKGLNFSDKLFITMEFYTYDIQNPVLKPFIQYILFNYSNRIENPYLIKSYANNNFCLGILNHKKLVELEDGKKTLAESNYITSYISGLYLKSFDFLVTGEQDEICIDFTPLGFKHFFNFPIKTFILNEDILHESFGPDSKLFFEAVFIENDFYKRGQVIEKFFLEKLKEYKNVFLKECLFKMGESEGNIKLYHLYKHLKCSEKKIYREFVTELDLTPKDYLRIIKFRKALKLLLYKNQSVTEAAYESSFTDPSHLNKEFNFFTQKSPTQFIKSSLDIDQKVIVSKSC
jgi:AraC-like DNA-binding protein